MSKATLEDALLNNIANQERFVKEFPFLKSIQEQRSRKSKGCGQCGKKSKGIDYNMIRRAILSMSTENKRKLLTLLNVDQLVVRVPNGRHIEQRTIIKSRLN